MTESETNEQKEEVKWTSVLWDSIYNPRHDIPDSDWIPKGYYDPGQPNDPEPPQWLDLKDSVAYQRNVDISNITQADIVEHWNYLRTGGGYSQSHFSRFTREIVSKELQENSIGKYKYWWYINDQHVRVLLAQKHGFHRARETRLAKILCEGKVGDEAPEEIRKEII